MARKKETEISISPEEQQDVQQLVANYHEIASTLHSSTNKTEAETALMPIHHASESAQMAFVKALAKENTIDSADILAAINALSEHKELRKEARRALIQLEGAKITPHWTPPTLSTPAIHVNIANPPRFWKGVVSQTREEGEVQVLLFWEQGYEYSEIRMLGFLLDFWQAGVKDVIVDMLTKRRSDERIADMRSKLSFTDCTLAEAKRLLEEALSMNTWRGTTPVQEYRNRLPLINQLLINATNLGEDRGSTFINPELEDQEVVVNFLGAWSLGDYGLAYDLLTHDCTIRDNLSRDEWIAQHRTWANEAHPTRIELGFVHEQEQAQQQSTLWLPSSTAFSRASTRKVIEIGWSVELTDTPLSGTLHELPMGTAINKETGRHWFWTNYTLMREQGQWRIQHGTDEGAAVQGLPIEELQQRIKASETIIETKAKQRDTDVNAFMQELSWRLTQLLHYYDALIARLPFDRQLCEDAYGRAIATGNPERTMVYLERLATRFAEGKGDALRRLGATMATLAYNYNPETMRSRVEHLLERAEQTLREAITLDDTAMSHALLAELLISTQRNDEAEAELLKAKEMTTNPQELAPIEAGLGNIAMRRERVEEALAHFERVAEINPDYSAIWFSIGFAQRLLGRMSEAEARYQRAIEVEPHDPRPYTELIAMYMGEQRRTEARNLAAQSVHANPDSATLHALFASVLFEIGETRSAQHELNEAEELNPDDELVKRVRQYIDKNKKR